MKKFFKIGCLGLIGLIVLGIIIGVASGGEDDSTESGPSVVENEEETNNENTDNQETDNQKVESNENEEDEIEDTEFNIGEKVELDGQVVEVTDVEKSQGGDFETPSEGNEYVIVHVTIENNGEDKISYNPFNFKMMNSNGQIEDQGLIMVDSDTSLSSGELAPGGNVSGTLSFEQPIDDDGLKLIFEPSFWGTDEIIFNISG